MPLKLDELYVEIKTKTDDFNRSLSEIKSNVKSVDTSINDVTERTSRWGNAATGINSIFETVRNTFSQLKQALGDASKASADLEVLRSSFTGTATDMNLFKTAVAGTVSEGSLIKLSNMATDLGISMSDQAIFFALAEDAADKYGGTVEENFNKVIAASEGSDKAVKSLGIQKAAYKQTLDELVKATGKELTSMDAEEQKLIRLDALRKASGLTLDDVKKKQQDNADVMESMSVASEEARASLGKLLNQALSPLLNAMRDNSGVRTFIGGLYEIGKVTLELIPILIQLKNLQQLETLTTAGTAGAAGAAGGLATRALGALKNFFSGTWPVAVGAAIGIGAGVLVDYIRDYGKESAEAAATALQEIKNSELQALLGSNKRYVAGKDGKIVEITIVENPANKLTQKQLEDKIISVQSKMKDLVPSSVEWIKLNSEVNSYNKLLEKPKVYTDEEIKKRRELVEQYRNETKIFSNEYDKRLDDSKTAYNSDIQRFKDNSNSKVELDKYQTERKKLLFQDIYKIEEERSAKSLQLAQSEVDFKGEMSKSEVRLRNGSQLEILSIEEDTLKKKHALYLSSQSEILRLATESYNNQLSKSKSATKNLVDTENKKKDDIIKIYSKIATKRATLSAIEGSYASLPSNATAIRERLSAQAKTLRAELADLENQVRVKSEQKISVPVITKDTTISSDISNIELNQKEKNLLEDKEYQLALQRNASATAQVKADIMKSYYDTVTFQDETYYQYMIDRFKKEEEDLINSGVKKIDAEKVTLDKIKALQTEQRTFTPKAEQDIKDLKFNAMPEGYDKEIAALDEWYEIEQKKYADNKEALLLLDEDYANRKKEIDDDVTNNSLQLAAGALGQLATIFGQQTAAYKVLAIAQATMDTYKAANMALASAPPPFGAILAGVSIATGLANVSKIASAHDGGNFIGTSSGVMKMASGGSFTVPNGYPNDSFPLMVESGERVSVTSTASVGSQEKLLGELIGSVRAMNKNFMMKNMSVNIDANIDGLTFVKKTTKPAENRLTKNGYKLENL